MAIPTGTLFEPILAVGRFRPQVVRSPTSQEVRAGHHLFDTISCLLIRSCWATSTTSRSVTHFPRGLNRASSTLVVEQSAKERHCAVSAFLSDAGYRVVRVRTRYQEKTDQALGLGALLAFGVVAFLLDCRPFRCAADCEAS